MNVRFSCSEKLSQKNADHLIVSSSPPFQQRDDVAEPFERDDGGDQFTYYQPPTKGQITVSRREAPPGRETRRADRRASLPHPPSLSHS
jgi:hypothetical protein